MDNKKNKISLTTYIVTLIIMVILIAILVCIIIKGNIDKKELENSMNKQEILSNSTENKTMEENTENNKIVSEDNNFIVLYNGEEIKKDIGKQTLSYSMKNTSKNKKKYNIKYFNYNKNKYRGETTGVFGKKETYEGYSFVDNVETVAISKKYDAIPRKSKKMDDMKLPEKLNEFLDYSNIDIESIDLDGDGKKEYIFCLQKETSKEDYDTDENEAYSEIVLFNSDYDKIATLASWENKGVEKFNKDEFLQLNDIMYIDIDNDNDNVMEILVELPAYESSVLSILKYNNNKIDGKTDIEVDMTP